MGWRYDWCKLRCNVQHFFLFVSEFYSYSFSSLRIPSGSFLQASLPVKYTYSVLVHTPWSLLQNSFESIVIYIYIYIAYENRPNDAHSREARKYEIKPIESTYLYYRGNINKNTRCATRIATAKKRTPIKGEIPTVVVLSNDGSIPQSLKYITKHQFVLKFNYFTGGDIINSSSIVFLDIHQFFKL